MDVCKGNAPFSHGSEPSVIASIRTDYMGHREGIEPSFLLVMRSVLFIRRPADIGTSSRVFACISGLKFPYALVCITLVLAVSEGLAPYALFKGTIYFQDRVNASVDSLTSPLCYHYTTSGKPDARSRT